MGKTFGEAGPAYIPVRVTFDTIADASRDSLCTHEAKSEPTDKLTHRRTQPTIGPTSVLTPPSGTHPDPWDNSRRAHPPVAMFPRGRGCVLEQPLSFCGLWWLILRSPEPVATASLIPPLIGNSRLLEVGRPARSECRSRPNDNPTDIGVCNVQGQQLTASPLSSSSLIMSDITITGYQTHDVRFPTSLTGDGTDAMCAEFLALTRVDGTRSAGMDLWTCFLGPIGTLIVTIHRHMLSSRHHLRASKASG